MTSDDQIRDEKLQYHINRETKLVSMNILPSNQKHQIKTHCKKFLLL